MTTAQQINADQVEEVAALAQLPKSDVHQGNDASMKTQEVTTLAQDNLNVPGAGSGYKKGGTNQRESELPPLVPYVNPYAELAQRMAMVDAMLTSMENKLSQASIAGQRLESAFHETHHILLGAQLGLLQKAVAGETEHYDKIQAYLLPDGHYRCPHCGEGALELRLIPETNEPFIACTNRDKNGCSYTTWILRSDLTAQYNMS